MDANNKDLENRVVALEIFVERLKAGAGEVAALPDDVTFSYGNFLFCACIGTQNVNAHKSKGDRFAKAVFSETGTRHGGNSPANY